MKVYLSNYTEIIEEVLKKILATGWLNNELSCQVEELLAQSKPLSEDDIRTIVNQLPTEVGLDTGIEFARIIEKAHGIQPVKYQFTTRPEQEPLSDGEITTNIPKTIPIGERLAFHAGIRWAEKCHGIGGGE